MKFKDLPIDELFSLSYGVQNLNGNPVIYQKDDIASAFPVGHLMIEDDVEIIPIKEEGDIINVQA